MTKEVKNIAASVKERLRNISHETGREYQSLLRQYIQERFLYRLSESPYKNFLILKGALLFVAYDISRLRPTRDIDFLGSSIPNDRKEITEIVGQILRIEFEDGVRFDPVSIESEDIAEDDDYHGVRIKFFAYLENSRERVQIDIGFGDKITSGPIEIEYPTLLEFQPPRLKVYSVESAIAEKFEAVVSLQLQTSRMKDFYDILFFASNYHFNNVVLKEAIETTFNNRNTNVQLRKVIYNIKFKTDTQLQKYWSAFLSRNKLVAENNFVTVIDRIVEFIEPIFVDDTSSRWDCKLWKWI